eukprot:9353139-Alexandrium_andersonii.AAC.1
MCIRDRFLTFGLGNTQPQTSSAHGKQLNFGVRNRPTPKFRPGRKLHTHRALTKPELRGRAVSNPKVTLLNVSN